jgi:hypothetical protein
MMATGYIAVVVTSWWALYHPAHGDHIGAVAGCGRNCAARSPRRFAATVLRPEARRGAVAQPGEAAHRAAGRAIDLFKLIPARHSIPRRALVIDTPRGLFCYTGVGSSIPRPRSVAPMTAFAARAARLA